MNRTVTATVITAVATLVLTGCAIDRRTDTNTDPTLRVADTDVVTTEPTLPDHPVATANGLPIVPNPTEPPATDPTDAPPDPRGAAVNDDPTEPTEPITDPVNPTEPPRLPPRTTWDPPGDGQTIDRVPPVVDPPDESIGE